MRHTQASRGVEMARTILFLALVLVLKEFLVFGCLITNCPRGGKRSGKFIAAENVKPCISCGPGRTGQCFGPNICCGPFGCLMGTHETLRCLQEGNFYDREPCIAGTGTCRRNTGRCAIEGVCCTQESCHSDKTCVLDEKGRPTSLTDNMGQIDLYSLLSYQGEYNPEN